MKGVAVVLLAAVGAGAQQVTLAAKDQPLAREVFRTLIETNTTHSTGSTTAAAEKMRDLLLKEGFPAGDMEIVGPSDKRMNLVVRWRGSSKTEKPVLTIVHLDVVEAKREDWTVDPFVFTEKDGFFYGRGTQDVKDGDAAYVTSFILLKRAGFVPKRDLILALTADEEGGSENGVNWLLKNRRDLVDAEFAINPDAGGVALRDGKPLEVELEATEKMYADFELKATNAGGHSSLPRKENAIYQVADALGRIEAHPFPVELNAVTRGFFTVQMELTRPEFKPLMERLLHEPMDVDAAEELARRSPNYNAKLRTTCVATMIAGGHAFNALPGSATANVNCRILPGHSAEEVRQRLVEIVADPHVSVGYRGDDGAVKAHADNRGSMTPPPVRADVMGAISGVVVEMWPETPIVPTMESGASDSIFTSGAGIPSYGVSGMGIPEGGDRAHGRDERLGVAAYYQGVEFTRRLVKALGEE